MNNANLPESLILSNEDTIKALEQCCMQTDTRCSDCPANLQNVTTCVRAMAMGALNIIYSCYQEQPTVPQDENTLSVLAWKNRTRASSLYLNGELICVICGECGEPLTNNETPHSFFLRSEVLSKPRKLAANTLSEAQKEVEELLLPLYQERIAEYEEAAAELRKEFAALAKAFSEKNNSE